MTGDGQVRPKKKKEVKIVLLERSVRKVE